MEYPWSGLKLGNGARKPGSFLVGAAHLDLLAQPALGATVEVGAGMPCCGTPG